MKQKQNENFYSNPHYYAIKDKIEKSNISHQKFNVNHNNVYNREEGIIDKREKSFVLDCTNKLKLPKSYNGLYDKHLANFLSKISTLSALKESGVINKHELEGNSLFIYENYHNKQNVRKRVINYPENMKVELARLKSKSFHRFKSADKLPILSQNIEIKDEQFTRRSSNAALEQTVQLKDEKQEKNNHSLDDRAKFFKELNNCEQGNKQKISAIIKITTKQKLNDSKQNSPNRDTSQTTCETKSPHLNKKLHYDLQRNRNQSSHQLGCYRQNQNSLNSTIKGDSILRNQNSPNSFRFTQNQRKQSSSVDPSQKSVDQISSAKNTLYKINQVSNEENAKDDKQQRENFNDSTFVQFQPYSINLKQQGKFQKVRIPSSSLAKMKVIGPYPKARFDIKNNKRQNDNNENLQVITKDDFLKMMKVYREKAEESLKKELKVQDQNEEEIKDNKDVYKIVINQTNQENFNQNQDEKNNSHNVSQYENEKFDLSQDQIDQPKQEINQSEIK